jgi:hypothetical protein
MTLIGLLIAFQIKHFVCDYLLQGEYMLGKFKKEGWILPLSAHCGAHFLGTFAILMAIGSDVDTAVALGWFDFGVHFLMDRVKASPALMGRWKPLTAAEYVQMKEMLNPKPFDFESYVDDFEARARLRSNKLFWWALGFDQMIHHLTHYAVIVLYALSQ